jgi:hypothetical protein
VNLQSQTRPRLTDHQQRTRSRLSFPNAAQPPRLTAAVPSISAL